MDPRTNLPLRKRLEAMPVEELTSLRHQLDELRRDPAMIVLTEALAEAREASGQRIVHGPTLEPADYGRAIGYASGLDELGAIMELIESLAEKREREIREAAEADRQRRKEPAWTPAV